MPRRKNRRAARPKGDYTQDIIINKVKDSCGVTKKLVKEVISLIAQNISQELADKEEAVIPWIGTKMSLRRRKLNRKIKRYDGREVEDDDAIHKVEVMSSWKLSPVMGAIIWEHFGSPSGVRREALERFYSLRGVDMPDPGWRTFMSPEEFDKPENQIRVTDRKGGEELECLKCDKCGGKMMAAGMVTLVCSSGGCNIVNCPWDIISTIRRKHPDHVLKVPNVNKYIDQERALISGEVDASEVAKDRKCAEGQLFISSDDNSSYEGDH